MVRYQWNQDDIIAGNALWRRATMKPWRFLAAALVVLLGSFGLMRVLGEPLWNAAGLSLLMSPVMIGAILALTIYGTRHSSLRNFNLTKANQRPLEAAWDETHLTITNANGFQKHPWTEFKCWAEGPTVIAFLHHAPLFTLVPKRSLSDEQLEEIRHHVERSGLPRARLFPF